jgi:hypothetical protein
MKTTFLLLTTFAASAFLPAQDQKGGDHQMPNPKQPEHAALSQFAGNWTSTCKMAAMPGVPGMEKPSECNGTVRGDLICNGLWLKWTMDGNWNGQPSQCAWLVGYDPFAKKYTSVAVSNMDEQPFGQLDGTYDAASKTWTFTGKCKNGEMRSVITAKDANSLSETCYMTGKDGKESECMQATYTRAKSGLPSDASAKASKPADKQAPKEIAVLAEDVGTWDATVTHSMPGQAPQTDKGAEVVSLICNGKWQWTDFNGSMMGQPFEGHGITGWDPDKKQYVSVWIDSMSATPAITTGTYDETKKTFSLSGQCVDQTGQPMSITQRCARPDASTRNLDMSFKGAQSSDMKIVYKKKG